MIGEFIFDAIKSKIFGSKDYFERVKKRLVGSLITPLFIYVGTPTALLSALSNIQYIEVNSYGSVIKFLGAASSDFVYLSISVLVTFLSALGCNLYYSLHNTKIMSELKKLEELEDRQKAYKQLVEKFNEYITNSDHDKALRLGSFIVSQYKSEVEKTPEIIFILLELPNGKELILDSDPRNQLSHEPA